MAWYRFGDNIRPVNPYIGSDNLLDYSCNEYHMQAFTDTGTIVDPDFDKPPIARGSVWGDSLALDGTYSAKFISTRDKVFPVLSKMTVLGWFKAPTNLYDRNNTASILKNYIFRFINNGRVVYGLGLKTPDASNTLMDFNGSDINNPAQPRGFNDNAWHSFVLTVDATIPAQSKIKLVLNQATTLEDVININISAANNSILEIGYRWYGDLDEIMFYPRILAQENIVELLANPNVAVTCTTQTPTPTTTPSRSITASPTPTPTRAQYDAVIHIPSVVPSFWAPKTYKNLNLKDYVDAYIDNNPTNGVPWDRSLKLNATVYVDSGTVIYADTGEADNTKEVIEYIKLKTPLPKGGQTWKVPKGVTTVDVFLVGGGGGGGWGVKSGVDGSAPAPLPGGGGGGGGATYQAAYDVKPGATIKLTIGAGGTPCTNTAALAGGAVNGGAGGDTTFDNGKLKAGGGAGGLANGVGGSCGTGDQIFTFPDGSKIGGDGGRGLSNGSEGILCPIDANFYGGGGGGGGPTSGGRGGGGGGASAFYPGANWSAPWGVADTGGGGGGGFGSTGKGWGSGTNSGGGASGLIILRYTIPSTVAASTPTDAFSILNGGSKGTSTKFRNDTILKIINDGFILGGGGPGGTAKSITGGAGGNAIYCDLPCQIINRAGKIYGGGGGGGAGNPASYSEYQKSEGGNTCGSSCRGWYGGGERASCPSNCTCCNYTCSGCGDKGGCPSTWTKHGTTCGCNCCVFYIFYCDRTVTVALNGGNGGNGEGYGSPAKPGLLGGSGYSNVSGKTVYAGNGGAGGAYGKIGSPSNNGGLGGPAGYYIKSGGKVTFTNMAAPANIAGNFS